MAGETYKFVVDAAQAYLKETNSVNSSNSKNYKQIVEAILKKIASKPEAIETTVGTIVSYLSKAANNDPASGIVSGGSRAGYWYTEIVPVSAKKESDTQTVSTEKGKSVKLAEKDLYPLTELWLQEKGYTSKDISNLKSGGRWGNPDIIGIDRVDIFGAVELDLATCEVKLGIDNWETVIFEAISHKRFANRSWFCYRIEDPNQPMPKGMEYYAERYRVGVVQMILSDQDMVALKEKSKTPLDLLDNVIERIPALYDYVPLREQRDLIERADISMTLKF